MTPVFRPIQTFEQLVRQTLRLPLTVTPVPYIDGYKRLLRAIQNPHLLED